MWYWMIPPAIITGVTLLIPPYVHLAANLVDTWGYVRKKLII